MSSNAGDPVDLLTPLGLPDPEQLLEICRYRMPFGKYEGMRVVQLPEAYLAWFARKGMPAGKLGKMLETALVIRSNGLEKLVAPLIEQAEREYRGR